MKRIRRARHPAGTCVAVALLASASAGVVGASEPPSARPSTSQPSTSQPSHLGDWNFRALLDGKPIGEHRFTVTAEGEGRKVVSVASFDVKFLMVTAYRYRHRATEHWAGGCLDALSSNTDDDGKAGKVRAEREGSALEVRTDTGTRRLDGCVMSFAYWNPDIRSQPALLNAQTGRYENVSIQRVGTGTIDVRGQTVPATQFRISGPKEPIDIWYSSKGEWIGLDSTVAGGRTLSYRLEQ